MRFKNKQETEKLYLDKSLGQHFLRDEQISQYAASYISLKPTDNIFEIGCGDGFLTKEILTNNIARLWVFEIDEKWAQYVAYKFDSDPRITVFNENFLQTDFTQMAQYGTWKLIANLPYNITFSILDKLVLNRNIIDEAVIMLQEEVAQKLAKTSGRGYGFISLYFSHYFNITLLKKIPPSAFNPPPKVLSRLIHLKRIENLDVIDNESEFWIFIKRIFAQPRRTIKNNLQTFSYNLASLDEKTLNLRAQQLNKLELIALFKRIL